MDWDFFPADVGTAPDAVLAFFAAEGNRRTNTPR